VSGTAIDAVAADHPDRPGYLLNLGNARHAMSQVTGLASDLDTAINALRAGVRATPPGHPVRLSLLGNLGDSLRERYERTNDLNDLEAAIEILTEAVQTAGTNGRLTKLVSNLVSARRARFERFGDIADIDSAVAAVTNVLASDAVPPVDRSAMLSNLANYLRQRYQAAGTPLTWMPRSMRPSARSMRAWPVFRTGRGC
jgi:hypothetical protein